MVKSSDILRDKSLWRHFDLFGDANFHFHDVKRCNVIFLHQKLTKYMLTPVLQAKFLAGLLSM